MIDKKSAKEKMIRNINSRIEATQTINPITNQPYLEDKYPKFRILEDPIQVHLRAMEERNPSANEHRQGLLKTLIDRLSFIERVLQYRRSELNIFKVSSYKKLYSNLYNLSETNLEKYLINETKTNLENIIKINYKNR